MVPGASFSFWGTGEGGRLRFVVCTNPLPTLVVGAWPGGFHTMANWSTARRPVRRGSFYQSLGYHGPNGEAPNKRQERRGLLGHFGGRRARRSAGALDKVVARAWAGEGALLRVLLWGAVVVGP